MNYMITAFTIYQFSKRSSTEFAGYLEIVEIHFLSRTTASEDVSYVPTFNKAMFNPLAPDGVGFEIAWPVFFVFSN